MNNLKGRAIEISKRNKLLIFLRKASGTKPNIPLDTETRLPAEPAKFNLQF
jgi:hypothetical protein